MLDTYDAVALVQKQLKIEIERVCDMDADAWGTTRLHALADTLSALLQYSEWLQHA